MTSIIVRYFVVIPIVGPMIGLFYDEKEAKEWAEQSGTKYKAIEPVILHQTHSAPDEEESHRQPPPNR